MKGMVVPATMFEELGFQYFGPVDGHDLPNLVKVLQNIKGLNGPLLLHAVGDRQEKGSGRQKSCHTNLHRGVRQLALRHGT